MVPQKYIRLLFLRHPQRRARMRRSRNLPMLIVILRHIPRFRVEITRLEENAVFIRNLLFEPPGQA